jgi:prepilin-type N-terminal cleavage/methylation domain-containing protein
MSGTAVDRRGFTLVEILVALTILGLVLTMSLAIFFDRQKRLLHAAEMISASQALSNEAEIWRHVSYGSLSPGGETDFVSDLEIIDSLPDPLTTVTFDQLEDEIRTVTMRVEWGKAEARRHAEMTIYRAPVNGGSLF